MMKWGFLLFLAGVAIGFFILWLGVLLGVIGLFIMFISLAPDEYDEEEQLDTEDEINLIYFDE